MSFFFFFKQKTAYEMRISDWSSDVCSSDLNVQLNTHNGTHLDAPYHFHSTMNKGERAWTIDEVPLEWCFGDGVKLDFRKHGDGYVVTAADVEAELKRVGYTLKPHDIVVVNTAAGAAYGKTSYVSTGCGMGYAATMYLQLGRAPV